MNLHDKIYNFLVRKNEHVQREYERYVMEHIEEHYENRFKHWKILWNLNWHYRVKNKNTPLLYFDKEGVNNNVQKVKRKVEIKTEEKIKTNNHISYPESLNGKKYNVDEIVNKLSAYDLISFDMFDTLIFRPFEDPKDIFWLVGNELEIPNFKNIRAKVESEARKEKKSNEVTIEDIYTTIEERLNVKKEKGIEIEFDLELKACYANPFMYEVYQRLCQLGCKMIVTSNMYLHKNQLKQILDKCGYTEIQDIYVSCEFECSKKYGKLQNKVIESINKGNQKVNRVIHVGDNYFMDIEGSRIAGWDTFYYKNINKLGSIYRPTEMSTVSASIYKGLTNEKLFSGFELNSYYEYGYAYVGYLVYGFCKWLNDLAKIKEIDKFLFVSRDMNVVYRVYKSFFGQVDSEYIKASRTSSIHLSFDRQTEHFFDWHVRRRISSCMEIEKVLEELDYKFLIDKLPEYGMCKNEILTSDNLEKFKMFVYDYKHLIEEKYVNEEVAAYKYYKEKIGDAKKICIVDLGWKASTYNSLKYFLNEKCKMNIEILSAMIGMEGHQFVDELLCTGKAFTYVFSDQNNVELMKTHNANGNVWRRIYEIIFTSNEQSLLKFNLDEKQNVVLEYLRKESRDERIVGNLHEGIFDFAKDYSMTENRLKMEFVIGPVDSYKPLQKIMYEEKYNFELFKDFEVCFIAGNVKEDNIELFKDVVRTGGK